MPSAREAASGQYLEQRNVAGRTAPNQATGQRALLMVNSFIIILREGFESFLLVAVILSYLRKGGLRWLSAAVYVGIGLAIAASAGLGYVLRYGVEESTLTRLFGERLGYYV